MRAGPDVFRKRDRCAIGTFAALIVIGLTVVPAAAAEAGEMHQAFPENDTAGYVPVDIIMIDPAIEAATPDYHFLVLDAEGKANYLRDLSADFDLLYAFDSQKETKYAALAAKLKAIWDKYPVVSETKSGSAGYPTYGGSEITIRFAPSVKETKLTDEENAAIRESAAIMSEAYRISHPTQPTPLSIAPGIVALAGTGLLVSYLRKGKE